MKPVNNKEDTFGSRVKKLRNSLKMLQAEFGKKLDISVTNLSEIENNKCKPGLDFFYNMVKAFGVNLNYLVYGEGPEPVKEGSPGLDLSRLGDGAPVVEVDEFLYYFFNSRFVRYYLMAEMVKVVNNNREFIENEIRSRKSEKK